MMRNLFDPIICASFLVWKSGAHAASEFTLDQSLRVSGDHSCAQLHSALSAFPPQSPHMRIQKATKSKKAGHLRSDIDPYVMDLLENIEEGKTVLRLPKD